MLLLSPSVAVAAAACCLQSRSIAIRNVMGKSERKKEGKKEANEIYTVCTSPSSLWQQQQQQQHQHRLMAQLGVLEINTLPCCAVLYYAAQRCDTMRCDAMRWDYCMAVVRVVWESERAACVYVKLAIHQRLTAAAAAIVLLWTTRPFATVSLYSLLFSCYFRSPFFFK